MFKSRINSREQLIQYCLRALGEPVFQVSVDKSQLEDRIDDAFDMFWEYHADGAQRVTMAIEITQDMIDKKQYQLPKEVLSVLRVLAGGAVDTLNPFVNLQYQMYITDLMNIRNFMSNGVSGYVVAQQYLNTIGDILSPEPIIEFNKHTQVLTVNQDWTRVTAGQFTVVECYVVVDPDQYAETFNNKWLKEYCTALIKRQWGTNIKKYGNVTLPGGLALNGQQIYDEADAEVKFLEQRLRDEYENPPDFYMG